MSKFETLPVIVVSALNDEIGIKIISELVDDEVTEMYREEGASPDCVWRIANKYYTVDVRLRVLSDTVHLEPNPHSHRIEAYIIHITEDEMRADGTEAAARRARTGGEAWRASGVRLALAAAERAPPALHAWALAARADLVPLAERGASAARAGGPFPELAGWERARAALHAHRWPGLRARRGPAAIASALDPEDSDSGAVSGSERAGESDSEAESGSEGVGESDAEEERAVERAEAFVVALGALGPAAETRGSSRDAAEDLVRAFCRALGLDPDTC